MEVISGEHIVIYSINNYYIYIYVKLNIESLAKFMCAT